MCAGVIEDKIDRPHSLTPIAVRKEINSRLLWLPGFWLGSIHSGLDNWYFVSDDHLRWHIKNLPLALWFEAGWFGVLALPLLVGMPLRGLVSLASRGDRGAQALLLSLTGFGIVSLTSSLFDFPRLSFQFFLVLFAAYIYVNLRYRRYSRKPGHGMSSAE